MGNHRKKLLVKGENTRCLQLPVPHMGHDPFQLSLDVKHLLIFVLWQYRAFADYIFGSIILHFFCINFIN